VGFFVIGEISAVLEWLFDDGVENERDAQLAPESEEARAERRPER